VYYEEGSPETGQTVAQVMDSVMNELGAQFGQQSPLFSVTRKATDTTIVSQFDYMFAGLLGFSILSLGFFGLAQMIPAWKKTGALRRLKVTPLTRGQLIFGTMLTFLVIGMLVLAVMFIVGMTVFGFDMRGEWTQIVPFLLLGTITIMGFGLLIGGAVKNENQAAALTNLTAFPMMFLSGVFFPSFMMPDWLQTVSGFMPLTPLVEGIRYIITENATLVDVAPQIGMLCGWLVVVYVAAIKLFRWE
jgi:ABC-2 type transport system permease protein